MALDESDMVERARSATITVNQTDRDVRDYKTLIRNLQRAGNHSSNPYKDRSESDIVKMLLDQILPGEYRRICGDDQNLD
jgi:hypothetical protein